MNNMHQGGRGGRESGEGVRVAVEGYIQIGIFGNGLEQDAMVSMRDRRIVAVIAPTCP